MTLKFALTFEISPSGGKSDGDAPAAAGTIEDRRPSTIWAKVAGIGCGMVGKLVELCGG